MEPVLLPPPRALLVVDMQRYYLEKDSPNVSLFETLEPDSMGYILNRCRETVIPNIQRLIRGCRSARIPVVYLRLTGRTSDRSDLHRFFRETWERAAEIGFPGVYPTESDPWSDVIPELAPEAGDAVFCKTTFSGFTSGSLSSWLEKHGIRSLIMSGLATSQCVETTARDASDRGYHVTHIEDAQADYDAVVHRASLIASSGVCGGLILNTETLVAALERGE